MVYDKEKAKIRYQIKKQKAAEAKQLAKREAEVQRLKEIEQKREYDIEITLEIGKQQHPRIDQSFGNVSK